MSAPVPEPNVILAAPDDSGFPYVLFFCVLGSLLAHAGTFFLFQVVYPQRVTIPQPAPHVSLLTPSSPENIALLRWIEAEDPALVANDNPLAPPGLAEVRYRPSFASPRTAPLGGSGRNHSGRALSPRRGSTLSRRLFAGHPRTRNDDPGSGNVHRVFRGLGRPPVVEESPFFLSLPRRGSGRAGQFPHRRG
ncbi:MAG: hypothetical protein WDN28_19790 [Chthoniobacter sp.]